MIGWAPEPVQLALDVDEDDGLSFADWIATLPPYGGNWQPSPPTETEPSE